MGEPAKKLPQVIGEMTVLWNDCQAVVFALFFLLLEAPLPKAKAVFFSIPSDRGQRRATESLLEIDQSDVAERAAKAIAKFNGMAKSRNAFTHAAWDFPPGSTAASNWQDTWKDEIGGDPLKKCQELIGRLETMHTDLKVIEQDLRRVVTSAQGAAGPAPLPLPLRQNISQTTNAAAQAPQQSGHLEELAQPQSSDQQPQ